MFRFESALFTFHHSLFEGTEYYFKFKILIPLWGSSNNVERITFKSISPKSMWCSFCFWFWTELCTEIRWHHCLWSVKARSWILLLSASVQFVHHSPELLVCRSKIHAVIPFLVTWVEPRGLWLIVGLYITFRPTSQNLRILLVYYLEHFRSFGDYTKLYHYRFQETIHFLCQHIKLRLKVQTTRSAKSFIFCKYNIVSHL